MRYSEGTEGLCWTQGQDGPKPLTPPSSVAQGGGTQGTEGPGVNSRGRSDPQQDPPSEFGRIHKALKALR